MKEIMLTKGQVALIDDSDYYLVAQHKWCALKRRSTWYALRSIRINHKNGVQYLHRFLLNPPANMQVDHINGNGLDCRRSNLRLATPSQNSSNRPKNIKREGYKGCYRSGNHWIAPIRFERKTIRIGAFETAEDAARAYDQAAKKYHGEFANLNGVPGDTIKRYAYTRAAVAHSNSGYIGVCKKKGTNLWASRMGIGNRKINLGYYKTPEEAARVYNDAVLKYRGKPGPNHV